MQTVWLKNLSQLDFLSNEFAFGTIDVKVYESSMSDMDIETTLN